jgi:hypothetical protein
LQLLILPLGALALVFAVATTALQASPPAAPAPKAAAATPAKQSEFPRHPEVEYERSVIRIPITFGGEASPREILELTAFMKLEREAPVRNTIGYRQFEFTIREWELFGYSESLGSHISFAASHDVVQPKSLAVALQKDSDYPALIVYNAIYDVFMDGKKILSQRPGVAMARGVVEIPPRNITVAFQKPFAVTRGGQVAAMNTALDCETDPDNWICKCHNDPNCTIFNPGDCEDMSTITREEFESGLREARAIRAQAATLKPKPTKQQPQQPAASAPAAGGARP